MTEREKSREPVMKTTNHERVSSFLMAVVSGLTILVFVLVLQLQTHKPVKAEPISPEIYPVPGSSPNNESKKLAGVESPEDQPELSYIAKVEIDFKELFRLINVGVRGINVVTFQEESATAETNPKKGKQGGTGYADEPLGDRPGSGDGDRWFIAFADKSSLETYARQLDFFNIEMAYLNLDTKTVTYVKNFSQKKPSSRVVKAGTDKRLAFLWQNKGRRAADVQLLQKAGVDATNGVIVHFYPAATVNILAETELRFTNRPLTEIRRTYFGVRPDGAGFKFVVTRFSYLE